MDFFVTYYRYEKRKRKRQKRYLHNGFTLIELLVVIAIVALLMAILIPSLRKARIQAMTVVCQSNLKQWGTIFTLYTNDYEGRFVPDLGAALWFFRGSQLEQDDPNIPPAISTYINSKGIGYCPLATDPSTCPPNSSTGFNFGAFSTYNPSDNIYGVLGSTFEAWVLTYPEPNFCGSYGFNQNSLSFHIMPRPASSRLGLNVFNIKRTYRFPILLDCTGPTGEIDTGRIRGGDFSEKRLLINRHDGGINCLFMDWSVRKVGLKELFTLKWSETFNTANRWTKAGGVQPEDWPPWMRQFKDY
jgi:prepilin-type N-terminal cleavage/methylation domain-containing protein/prepilin-type processing-associated H-X9-DG protein